MIEERKYTKYIPSCETCGWKGDPNPRRTYAERALESHPCGKHYEIHLNNGGYRGILGGTRRECVCGSSYITHEYNAPFICPRLSNSL